MADFEARELIIAHETIWQAVQKLAEERSCNLVCIFEGDEDDLPAYILSPKDFTVGEPQ